RHGAGGGSDVPDRTRRWGARAVGGAARQVGHRAALPVVLLFLLRLLHPLRSAERGAHAGEEGLRHPRGAGQRTRRHAHRRRRSQPRATHGLPLPLPPDSPRLPHGPPASPAPAARRPRGRHDRRAGQPDGLATRGASAERSGARRTRSSGVDGARIRAAGPVPGPGARPRPRRRSPHDGGHRAPFSAARYREIAADLARARTYGVDTRVIEYLERIVSAGHNALYRARGRRRVPLGRYVLREFPAAVVQSWLYVGAAFLLFMIPAIIGYALIRAQPNRTDELVPPVLVSRAEQAAERQRRGLGYAEARPEDLPVIASAIVSNNVLIAFWAFAGGVLLGLPTAWVLVQNGLVLGLGFGTFVNYHAGGYLATFVAGHGILELTAIFIAGGAGLRTAGAILIPGERTRRDAIILEGRIPALM